MTGSLRLVLLLAFCLIGTSFPLAPASAQATPDPALVALGEQSWKERFPCRNCHGGMADGVGDIPQEQGPNLRTADYLTPELVAELIRCGRPGTGMPYFDSRAYSDGRCYGMTAQNDAALIPPHGTPNATQRSIDGLVAFLFANFIGKNAAPTRAECVAIWGETAETCLRFQ